MKYVIGVIAFVLTFRSYREWVLNSSANNKNSKIRKVLTHAIDGHQKIHIVCGCVLCLLRYIMFINIMSIEWIFQTISEWNCKRQQFCHLPFIRIHVALKCTIYVYVQCTVSSMPMYELQSTKCLLWKYTRVQNYKLFQIEVQCVMLKSFGV